MPYADSGTRDEHNTETDKAHCTAVEDELRRRSASSTLIDY